MLTPAKSFVAWSLLLGLAAALPGCQTANVPPPSFSVRQMPDSDKMQVFARAEQALLDLGYTIASADAATGVISTVPIYGAGGGAARRNVLRSAGRTRLRAEVRVIEQAGVPSAYCKVIVEEESTLEYQLMRRDTSRTDLPHDTPIDRGGGASPQHDEVWQPLRRDRGQEMAILNRILGGRPIQSP